MHFINIGLRNDLVPSDEYLATTIIGNCDPNAVIFIKVKAFENFVCKMSDILLALAFNALNYLTVNDIQNLKCKSQ